jgi:hypothetical protein
LAETEEAGFVFARLRLNVLLCPIQSDPIMDESTARERRECVMALLEHVSRFTPGVGIEHQISIIGEMEHHPTKSDLLNQ